MATLCILRKDLFTAERKLPCVILLFSLFYLCLTNTFATKILRCNTQLDYANVTKHIVGSRHLGKVTGHLRRHQESLVNGDSLEGDTDSVADDDTAMQAEMSLQDEEHAAQKQSASSKPKKAEKTADAAGDGESQNSLPIMQDGLLVVNGVDVGKYIRKLEERISELEKKP